LQQFLLAISLYLTSLW